jgi:hypothetical protein
MELIFIGFAIIIGLALFMAAIRGIVLCGVFFALGCMFAPLFNAHAPVSFAPALVLFIALLLAHGWLNSDVTRYEVRRY